MFNKLLLTSLFTTATLLSAANYIPNLSEELSHNKQLLKEYKEGIKQLEMRNAFLEKTKKSNPKLYEEKPLFEETKTAYIQRIKLGGAEAKNINFKVENHIATISMNIKIERKDKNSYYQSSRSFYQEYQIPKNVKESEIKNYVDGDYFVIKMPKK